MRGRRPHWPLYALTCPDTGKVRYIGHTFSDPAERLRRHINDSRRTHYRNSTSKKAEWMRGLSGVPGIVVLQTGTEADAMRAEEMWIEIFKAAEIGLLNSRAGRVKR